MDLGCEDIKRLITERTERTLLSGEASAVSRHLRECEACNRFMRLHDEALGLYEKFYTREAQALVSSDFTDRVLDRLQKTPSSHLAQKAGEPQQLPATRIDTAVSLPEASTPTRPSLRKRGTLHLLFRPRILVAAAAVLILAVVGRIILLDHAAPELNYWSPSVVWQSAESTDWIPVTGNLNLTTGDSIYVFPHNHANVKLADEAILHVGGDSLVEQLAGGSRVTAGIVLLRSSNRGPRVIETPFATVEVGEGDYFLGVHRPDDCLAGSAAPRSASGELVVWTLRGTARVKRNGVEFLVNTGEARTLIPGAPPYALGETEKAALGRSIDSLGRKGKGTGAGWIPEKGMVLSSSLPRALASGSVIESVQALHTAGRLGFQNIVAGAMKEEASASRRAPAFRAALVQAVIRTRPSGAVPELLSLLQDKDAGVKTQAIRGLGVLGHEDAVTRLHQIVEGEEDPALQHQAADSLARLSHPIDPDQHVSLAREHEQRTVLAALWNLKDDILLANPDALEKAGGYLVDRERNAEVRYQAISLLAAIRGPEAEKYCLKALDDPVARIRTRALNMISRNKKSRAPLDPRIQDRIRAMALDSNAGENERTMAVSALVNRCVVARHDLERMIYNQKAPDKTRAMAVTGLARLEDKVTASDVRYFFATLDSEALAPVQTLAALVQLFGSVASGPDKDWLIERLEDGRKGIALAASKALHSVLRRGSILSRGEIDLLMTALDRVAWPKVKNALTDLITGQLSSEETLAFLFQRLEAAKADYGVNLIRQLGKTRSLASIPVLTKLLSHEDAQIVQASANTLATFGRSAGTAIPDLLSRFKSCIERDPGVKDKTTFDLARSALRVGATREMLPVFTRLIAQGGLHAVEAVSEIYRALGPEGAALVLVRFRKNPDSAIRLQVAKHFLQDASVTVAGEVRTWWQGEKDPWTRFALAFVLVDHDRAPAGDALNALVVEATPAQRQALVRYVGARHFKSLQEVVADPVRALPERFKEGVLRFVNGYALPGGHRLMNRFTKHPHSPTAGIMASLEAFEARWVDRVRQVRWGLWSSSSAVRKAAILDARAVLDRCLIPVLIDKLRDPSLEVRQAAAETLSRIHGKSMAGYRAEDKGGNLDQRIDIIRKTFEGLDLEKILPRPLPVILSRS